jgi:trk system potassium uptake protein TrkA
VARVYDPARAPLFEQLGLQTIASSSWGAQRIEQLLLHPGLESVYAAGHGEVQVYEIVVPEAWHNRRLAELLPAGQAMPVSITRAGRAQIPANDLVLSRADVLHVSASAQGADTLRERLHANGKE